MNSVRTIVKLPQLPQRLSANCGIFLSLPNGWASPRTLKTLNTVLKRLYDIANILEGSTIGSQQSGVESWEKVDKRTLDLRK